MSATAFEVSLVQDTATPALDARLASVALARVQRAVGTACTVLTKNWLNSLTPNKQGWPTQGLYPGAARGTVWDRTSTGVTIKIENEQHPGAMRQRFYGGLILAQDHLLTIPARQEFYGQRATDFTNLRFVKFRSGAMALVIGQEGTDRVNWKTGGEKRVKGTGVRAGLMVAYWLRESVFQEGDTNILPGPDEYLATAKLAVQMLVQEGGRN